MLNDAMNELTFAGWLAEFTATRARRNIDAGEPVLISSGAIEERQVDDEGRLRRCDLRFNSASGRKLASGELKRPEVAEGRDTRNVHPVVHGHDKLFVMGIARRYIFQLRHKIGGMKTMCYLARQRS